MADGQTVKSEDPVPGTSRATISGSGDVGGQLNAQTEATKEDQIGRTFSGLASEDIEEFVEYVDAVKDGNGWSQSRTAKRVKIKLLGEALLFVRVKRRQGVVLDTWDTDSPDADRTLTLKHALLERFSRELSATDIANLLYDCRQGTDEAVQSYYYRVLRVVQKKNEEIINDTVSFISQCDRDHFMTFINGIHPEIRSAILGVASPPKNSSEALKAAKNFEQQKVAMKKSVSEVSFAGPGRGRGNVRGRGGRPGQRNRGNRIASGSWYNRQMETLRSRCWECGSDQHLKAQCPQLGRRGNFQPGRANINKGSHGRGRVNVSAVDREEDPGPGREDSESAKELMWENPGILEERPGPSGNTQFFQ